MSLGQEQSLFGRLALHYKLITPEQLAEAARRQSEEGGRRRLGEILVECGFLTPRRLEQLLAAQKEIQRRQAAGSPEPAAAPAGMTSAVRPTVGRLEAFDPGELSRGARIDRILGYAVRQGASDIHLHSGAPLKLRRNGRLMEFESAVLDPAVAERILREVLSAEQQATLDERGQVDFAHTMPNAGRFRVNVYRQQRGLDGVFRAIPTHPPTLADLSLPSTLARFANYHQGLVLITGPAGCGKTATLAAMINLINEDRREHVITIEDPIEVLHPSKLCLINQRQVGRHTGSFARALRAALREDPDVIAIGELRDLETIALALTAAETGHLVLATLHTSNAVRTINRILGVYPPSQQEQIRTMLSESLRVVISQRLVARVDATSRVPALEILIATKAVGNLIRDNKTHQIRSILQTGAAHGMCLLDASLADLVKSGTISREEAMRHAEEPQRFATAGAAGAA